MFASDERHVWRMLAAAWQCGMVVFRYWGGFKPGAGRRVAPESVFNIAGGIEIHAGGFCYGRSERRVFRLDRVYRSAE